MTEPKQEKLLWDDAKFAKLYSSAERLTGVFGEKLLEQAGIPHYPHDQPLVILDNACGTGVVTRALQELLQDRPADSFEVQCGDFADAMVNAITQRILDAGWTNVRAQKVDAQDTRLPSNHFTHIFTNFGPMLFPNPSAMLSECNRMLRPWGVCGFTTWKQVGWIDDFRQALESLPELPPFPTAEKFASAFNKGHWDDEDYVRGELIKHGFENIRIEAVPNTSVAQNMTEFQHTLKPMLAIIYKFWSEQERMEFANAETEQKIGKWFENKYGDGPVKWQWIALISTSTRSK